VRILVVDDEPGICELVSWALKADGHTVVTAGTWADALRVWTAWGAGDGAVVDATLPDTDPADVVERLSEWARAGRHVLLITGWQEAVWPVPVLHKPFRLETLRRLVAGWASGR
jgi:two-component system OmpR family response regulator